MSSFAEVIAKEIGHPQVTKEELSIAKTDRFAFFKIGPVLSISVSHTILYSLTFQG
jgi:uridine phosphorylase